MIYFRRFAARNPGTAPAKLTRLTRDVDPTVRELAARNPSTPQYALAALAVDAAPAVREAIAGNVSTPPETLEAMARDARVTDPVLVAIAGNEATPVVTLTRLSSSRNSAVLSAVSGNRAVPVSVRAKLFKVEALRSVLRSTGYLFESINDRVAIASRAYGVADEQRILAHDLEADVRRAVAAATSPPQDILDILSADDDPRVASVALVRRSTRPSYLARCRDSEDELVLAFLFRNPATPSELRPDLARRLIRGADHETLGSIARDALTPPDVFDALSRHASDRIRNWVAHNPTVPTAVLHSMTGDTNSAVRAHLAADERLPLAALVRLASDGEAEVRVAVAGNLCTPPELLTRLAADADAGVALNVARNPNVTAKALQRIVQTRVARRMDSLEIRYSMGPDPILAVAENPVTPADVLQELESRYQQERVTAGPSLGPYNKAMEPDEAWSDVRTAIGANPSAPDHLLLKMARSVVSDQKKAAIGRYGPKFPTDADRKRERILSAIVSNPATSATVLELLRDGSWVAARTCRVTYREDGHTLHDDEVDHFATEAARKSASREIERRLSQLSWTGSTHPGVRLRYAQDPDTDPEILVELARDSDVSIRAAVAAHPATPVAEFTRLASDPQVEVRAAAARATHDHISLWPGKYVEAGDGEPQHYQEAFEMLAQDPAPEIRIAVIENGKVFWGLLEEASHERAAYDPDASVRAALVRSYAGDRMSSGSGQLSPKAVEHLALGDDPEIWRSLAAHYYTPTTVLHQLIETGDAETMRVISDRYELDFRIIERLAASEDPGVLARVAARAGSSVKICRILAGNPAAPVDVLDAIGKRSGDPEVLLALTLNPRSPKGLLSNFATSTEAWRQRLALASNDTATLVILSGNPALSVDVLEHLAQRDEPAIRENLIVNETTPPDVLVALLQPAPDENGAAPREPYVLPNDWAREADFTESGS